MKQSVERIIPMDHRIKEKYEKHMKQHFEEWVIKWVGKKIAIHSGRLENIEYLEGEQILIYVEDNLIVKFGCSLANFICLICGEEIGDDTDIASNLVVNLASDYVNGIGFTGKKNIRIDLRAESSMSIPNSIISIETSLGFIQVNFYSDTYAWFLGRFYLEDDIFSTINNMNIQNRAIPLSEQEIRINMDIEGIILPVKNLVELAIGHLLVSNQKLDEPVPLKVNTNIVGRAFVGKFNKHKAISLGGN